ncbi:hypothetical protein ACK3FM_003091 [Vibrio cholerae]|nr:hypothetical protein [Vibrio cholerae]EJL6466978.1 hypothetical protein [Vibrio cholerae]EJL6705921.1 hypothetical protein [Vibrio cholerae]EJL9424135.1 hypothetical protein [Vibrio cholerae]
MNFKKLPKKTIYILVFAAFLVIYSAYDFISSDSPQPQVVGDDVELDVYKQIDLAEQEQSLSTSVDVASATTEPKKRSVDDVRNQPSANYETQKPTSVTKANPEVKEPTFKLTKDGEKVLRNLESKYSNTVQIDYVNSQIALKEAQKKLAELNAPSIDEVQQKALEKVALTIPFKDRIVVSSIITSTKSKRAWVNVDGEDLPIAEGAAFYGVKVVSISSNSVIFRDLGTNETFQKFFNHQMVPEGGLNE